MYKIVKKEKTKKRAKNNKEQSKFLNMAIIMFISFSILNFFLIFNIMSILNNIAII